MSVRNTKKSLQPPEQNSCQHLELDAAPLFSTLKENELFSGFDTNKIMLVMIALVEASFHEVLSADVWLFIHGRAKSLCLQAGLSEKEFQGIWGALLIAKQKRFEKNPISNLFKR